MFSSSFEHKISAFVRECCIFWVVVDEKEGENGGRQEGRKGPLYGTRNR